VIIEGGTLAAGKTAVSLGGSPKRFVARGVTIKSKGDGVRLYGSTLEATIEGGSIHADKTALIATYGAKAEVKGTRIEGGEAAVRAERDSAVTLDSSVTVEGKIRQSRGGTVSGTCLRPPPAWSKPRRWNPFQPAKRSSSTCSAPW